MRRENRKENSLIGQNIERLFIDCCFGKPHSFRLALEPPAKIVDSPAHFCHLVAIGRERKDSVMIWHRDRITVAELLEAQAISFQYRCVSGWRICLHPFEKRWADVEAHSCIEIVAMLNFPIGTEHSRLSHRRVAFTVHPLIPV